MLRVLCLDGGGVRGIIPASILAELERRLRTELQDPAAQLADYFDLIAGTSVGGILSCLYALPGKGDKPLLDAQDVLQLFLKSAPQIFSVPWSHRFWSLLGWAAPTYCSKPLAALIDQQAPNLKFSELRRPVMAVAYDLKAEKPHVFCSMLRADGLGQDFRLRDVVLGTSAAPTYFPPEVVQSLGPEPTTLELIDGGVVANNPTVLTLTEVKKRHIYGATQSLFVVSISCGSRPPLTDPQAALKWGTAKWINPLINLMIAGSAQVVDLAVAGNFESLGKPEQYVRLDPPLIKASGNLDDVSPANIAALQEDAATFLADPLVGLKLKQVAAALVQIKKYGQL